MFDALIIGGGPAGIQCGLILGSAHIQEYAKNKRVGIVMHQKASDLQSALLNNVLGLSPGTSGTEILDTGKNHLASLYPHVTQIENEKVFSVTGNLGNFTIRTNKSEYKARLVVIALGYSNFFSIEGLNEFIEPHPKTQPEKERVRLKNTDHLVKPGIYVAGTLAGWRSQFAIAAGSGAQVGTDILTLWNNGKHTKVHDKLS